MDMVSDTKIDEVLGYVRLVLPLMSKHDIPITPRNYTIWYNHVSGVNAALSKAIESIIAERTGFTEQKNDMLYRQFCMEKDDSELFRIRDNLRQIMATVLRQMAELTGRNDEYDAFISNSITQLSNADMDDIGSVITEIIRKTKVLGQYSKSLQSKLKETSSALETLKMDYEQAKTEAFVDFLTGIPNRKAFNDTITIYTNEASTSEENQDISMLLIDIDHFKKFNDQHGHLIGDEVLKYVAKSIKAAIRGKDFVARFGGEEFAVLLPNTPLNGAAVVAENIRQFFAKTYIKSVSQQTSLGIVTVSIGVACYRPREASAKFICRCDVALYSAKANGRNRVEQAIDPPLSADDEKADALLSNAASIIADANVTASA